MDNHLMDDIARALASDIPRRRALRLIAGGIAGAALAHLGVKSAAAYPACQRGYSQCNQYCCNDLTQKCNGTQCCPRDQTVSCKGNCCPAGSTCTNGGGTCCPPGRVVCNDNCCAPGEVCNSEQKCAPPPPSK